MGWRKKFSRVAEDHLIYLNIVADSMGWSMLIPALPGLNQFFELSTVMTGSITSLVSILIFLSGTVQGRIADQIGKITMLRLSATSQLIGFLLMILALKVNSVAVFTLARCIPACFKCGMVVSQALLYEIRSEREYVKDIGILIAFSNVAYIIGPVIGGLLYSYHNQSIFFMGIFLSCLSLMLLEILDLDNRNNSNSNRRSQSQSQGHPSNSTDVTNGNLSEPPTPRPSYAVSASSSVCNSAKEALTSSQINQPSAISGNKPSTANNSSNHELFHYLHIKFAFQVGNTFFEAMFAQHSQKQFKFTTSQTGMLLGWCGTLSAITNMFILQKVTSIFEKPEYVLPFMAILLAIGLSIWATCSDVVSVVLSISTVTISSNLFLCILQGMIAKTQKRQHRKTSVEHAVQSNHLAEVVPTTLPTGDKHLMEKSDEDPIVTPINVVTNDNNNSSTTSVTSHTSTVHKSNRGMGAIMGMSSTADRAARIISPLVGSYFFDIYGNRGIVYFSTAVMVYCLTLIYMSQSSLHSNDQKPPFDFKVSLPASPIRVLRKYNSKMKIK